jgi:hypothetical protein
MPIYTNNSDTGSYVPKLPDSWTGTSDTPTAQPFQLLAVIITFPSVSLDVSQWDSVVIFNWSSGAVNLVANGDKANAMIIAAATNEELDNRQNLIETLTVTADKKLTGTVYIWGKTTATAKRCPEGLVTSMISSDGRSSEGHCPNKKVGSCTDNT